MNLNPRDVVIVSSNSKQTYQRRLFGFYVHNLQRDWIEMIQQ